MVASPLLVNLSAVFVSCVVISNILANCTLQVFQWSMDAGTLLFPITYVLSDVFSEVYGYKWSRRVTWMAAAMTLLFSLLVMIACALPQPDWFDGSHFELALKGSVRIVAASIGSYCAGDFVNDRVFSRMKRSGSNHFKTRALVSSVFGNTVDSWCFVMLAFAGTMPYEELLPMIMINIVFKTGYEALILPVTDRVVTKVYKKEFCK